MPKPIGAVMTDDAPTPEQMAELEAATAHEPADHEPEEGDDE